MGCGSPADRIFHAKDRNGYWPFGVFSFSIANPPPSLQFTAMNCNTVGLPCEGSRELLVAFTPKGILRTAVNMSLHAEAYFGRAGLFRSTVRDIASFARMRIIKRRQGVNISHVHARSRQGISRPFFNGIALFGAPCRHWMTPVTFSEGYSMRSSTGIVSSGAFAVIH